MKKKQLKAPPKNVPVQTGLWENLPVYDPNKKLPFYLELAYHIQAVGTFDKRTDTGGYPTIHWIIARSMLSEHNEYDRQELIRHYATKIRQTFEISIEALKAADIPVYVCRQGKRNIQYVSTDPNYDNAKNQDYERVKKNLRTHVTAGRRNMEYKHSDILQLGLRSEMKRLENKLIADETTKE